jgi:hypothetical protein
MKALSILALAAATFAAPAAWAGNTQVTVTQVAGPHTSVISIYQTVTVTYTVTVVTKNGKQKLSFDLNTLLNTGG